MYLVYVDCLLVDVVMVCVDVMWVLKSKYVVDLVIYGVLVILLDDVLGWIVGYGLLGKVLVVVMLNLCNDMYLVFDIIKLIVVDKDV